MKSSVNPNTQDFYNELYRGTWKIDGVSRPWQYEDHARRRFYFKLARLPFFKFRGKILDVGCGMGGLLASLPVDPHQRKYGVDFSEAGIKKCKARIRGDFRVGDIRRLPYRNEVFDRLTCVEILEHVDDPERVVSEMWRVLKPGGRLLITVPDESLDTPLSQWPECVSLHVRDFSCARLRELAETKPVEIEHLEVNERTIWLVAEKKTAQRAGPGLRARKTQSLKFLQVHTFYPPYFRSFYGRSAGLASRPFAEQIAELVKDGFSGAHLFAPYLSDLGYESRLVLANCAPAERQWALEHGAPPKSSMNVQEIVLRQVEYYKPDILYLTDPIAFDSRFVRALSYRPALVAGWRAADIPRGTDWSAFDLMLSHLSVCRDRALALGAKAVEHFFPGYPEFLATAVEDERKQWDVVFCGQVSPGHAKRNRFLGELARGSATRGAKFSLGYFLHGRRECLPPDLARINRGPRWGLEMLRALRSGRIVINAEADLARGEAGNMRLFETTGSGSFLLTERHPNIGQYFEPEKEIETFAGPEELKEKIVYYLAHPRERETIARRGQERCLKEYGMRPRARAFKRLVTKHLSLSPDSLSHRGARRSNDGEQTFAALNRTKAGHKPVRGIDFLRAVYFIRQGKPEAAREALKEELRFFSDNAEARALLRQIPDVPLSHLAGEAEFGELFRDVRTYTMLSEARLFSLYKLARRACLQNLPGNFVECGAAAGGSSALLAAVIKKYSRRPRRLYAFDSFEGLPEPTEHDTHRGIPASVTGWGAGTCAASEQSLLEICRRLGVEDVVVPIKGRFEKILPVYRQKVGPIALLHLDADWYSSTRAILENFFDQVVKGGFTQVDDYGFWEGCRKAVREFERRRGLTLGLQRIDGSGFWCVKRRLKKHARGAISLA